uniref:Transcription elongation factor, mitochondrial n=1 Tax=Leptobrachium leishanense TaxID=445787 RepID=A0A8C5WJ42_9ANUR
MIRSLQLVARAGKARIWKPPLTQGAHRTLHCSRCLAKSEGNLSLRSSSTETEAGGDDGRVSLNETYTEEEAETILNVLNYATEVELSRIKLMGGKKSSSIVQYRQENGPLLDLDNLLRVPHFQSKTAVKLFDSILNPVPNEQRKERKSEHKALSRLLKPGVPPEQLEATESIVSIVFGTQKIAWAHVDRKMTVLDWRENTWYRFMKGSYLSYVYLEDLSPLVSMIPKADIYVLEKRGIPIQNSNLFPVMLHLHMVEAMLYTLLNGQYALDGKHRVVSLGRVTVGKHFDLMVGESRTSGVEIVKKLLLEPAFQSKSLVRFLPELVLQYRSHFQISGQKRHEEMCDAVLQAIAFYDLLLPDSAPTLQK